MRALLRGTELRFESFYRGVRIGDLRERGLRVLLGERCCFVLRLELGLALDAITNAVGVFAGMGLGRARLLVRGVRSSFGVVELALELGELAIDNAATRLITFEPAQLLQRLVELALERGRVADREVRSLGSGRERFELCFGSNGATLRIAGRATRHYELGGEVLRFDELGLERGTELLAVR